MMHLHLLLCSSEQPDLVFSRRYVLSDLPSDIVIHIDEARFYLHKVIPYHLSILNQIRLRRFLYLRVKTMDPLMYSY
jgi:hypothetical protein